ncbi:putative sarcosine oxidase protein [Parachaetomium inaequale]|uniref:Sarcosine oxidase protein n=1 Tax=Parachaetomium inaequale TaxID=2588326 RepID=A0AAN6P5K8_9PEZI|nr:putative sarcosine oxidase protein [Parachaetomium inaequale]
MEPSTAGKRHPATVVIIGAGVFGLSTALHLRKSHPDVDVTVVDRMRGNRGGASSDHNKIIRADYPDPVYMGLAIEAQECWRKDPMLQPYYHECGMLFAEDINIGRASYANYKKIGQEPLSGRADTDAEYNYYNPHSGWGEAEEAMASVFQAALDAGVTFTEATARKLLPAPDGSCQGVTVQKDGELQDLVADLTVVCTGAYTAKLQADTAPERDELQVAGRMVAAAAVQCTATYPPDQEEKLLQAPVHFIGMWHTHGESIPPFKGRLKFNCEVSFLNMTYHEGLGKEISIPPAEQSQSTFSQDVLDGLKQEVANVVRNKYGNYVPGIQIENYRMCWDAVSPNQDFVIDYHPHCNNLIIAGAGSFHSWKFLPTIGKYVVQRIMGTLDEPLARKWAWDRENVGAACEMYIPTRDVKNIGPFQGWPRPGELVPVAQ